MNKFLNYLNNTSIIIKMKDVINFFRFKKHMKHLEKTDNRFHELQFKRNWLGNIVYFQINCTDEELAAYDYSPIDMVMNKIKPHIDYFVDNGWGDYIIPEINNFVDENNNNTLSYLIIFLYTPILFKLSRFFYTVFGLITLIGLGFAVYNFFIK